MYLGQALKLCPELKILDYDLSGCADISEVLYDVVAAKTTFIEAVSCDELYADVSFYAAANKKTAAEIAAEFRDEFVARTGITASVGGGPNKLIARLATAKAKPNGALIVNNEQTESFIKNVHLRSRV